QESLANLEIFLALKQHFLQSELGLASDALRIPEDRPLLDRAKVETAATREQFSEMVASRLLGAISAQANLLPGPEPEGASDKIDIAKQHSQFLERFDSLSQQLLETASQRDENIARRLEGWKLDYHPEAKADSPLVALWFYQGGKENGGWLLFELSN